MDRSGSRRPLLEVGHLGVDGLKVQGVHGVPEQCTAYKNCANIPGQ